MNNNDLAREHARDQATGQFGEQHHSVPEFGLEPDGPYVPGQPIRATVEYLEYESPTDEDPQTIELQSIDIAGVLDTLSLDDVKQLRDEPYVYTDDIVYTLQLTGELTRPDMPFGPLALNAGDVEAYADYREVNGLTDPISEEVQPSVRNLADVVTAKRDDIAALQAQIDAVRAEKATAEERLLRRYISGMYPEATSLVLQMDHHRYPVELFDDNGWVRITQEEERRLMTGVTGLVGTDPESVGQRGKPRTITLTD